MFKSFPEIQPAAVDRFVRPFQDFMARETSGGICLIACCVVAMVWANWSPGTYHDVWHMSFQVTIGEYLLKPGSLSHWINDGLMAIFFLLVGLEIKYELVSGHLSTYRKAIFPAFAALGGMIVPAAFYLIVNYDSWVSGDMAGRGWGIPMATDIAFAVGVLALLGNRIPVALKTFLVAVAIADDVGAVLVIAFGYTDAGSIDFMFLGFGGLIFMTLLLLNVLGVRNIVAYVVLGCMLWFSVLESGVHATVAGILLALTVPSRGYLDTRQFLKGQKQMLDAFSVSGNMSPSATMTPQQNLIRHKMADFCIYLSSPLDRLRVFFAPWVSFFIIPVFALANAGVVLFHDGTDAKFMDTLVHPVSLGIILGLVLGKQIGITLFSLLAVFLGIGEKPDGTTWWQVYGVSWLAGIGFTMSLFIGALAFAPVDGDGAGAFMNEGKVGVFAGSLLSGLIGYGILRFFLKAPPLKRV